MCQELHDVQRVTNHTANTRPSTTGRPIPLHVLISEHAPGHHPAGANSLRRRGTLLNHHNELISITTHTSYTDFETKICTLVHFDSRRDPGAWPLRSRPSQLGGNIRIQWQGLKVSVHAGSWEAVRLVLCGEAPLPKIEAWWFVEPAAAVKGEEPPPAYEYEANVCHVQRPKMLYVLFGKMGIKRYRQRLKAYDDARKAQDL